jgi:hypothetical protein
MKKYSNRLDIAVGMEYNGNTKRRQRCLREYLRL